MASVIFEEHVRIPLGLASLDDFRRWCHSNDFPDQGRIDYIGGDVEVDMSPEDFFTHGTLKSELVGALRSIIKRADWGHLVTDRTRLSHVDADLSAEPDVVFVSHAALDENRVRLVPKATGEADRYVEIEGSPDLVVEIVSDSSFQKDTQRLPKAYFDAGVPEYWLVDARPDPLIFQIHHRGDKGFEPADAGDDDFQPSTVLKCHFRLDRARTSRGYWEYDLRAR